MKKNKILGFSDHRKKNKYSYLLLEKGFSKNDALRVAIKEIGLATLLTSVTTAIGFAALSTSKVIPIKEFGWNAAMGVMVAYITVIFFTTALLSMYDEKQLIKLGKGEAFWGNMMNVVYSKNIN